MPAATADEAATGYAPVYYPGTTTPSSAATVTVGPGEEKGSIDFQYQVVPIARVDGIVTSTTTQLRRTFRCRSSTRRSPCRASLRGALAPMRRARSGFPTCHQASTRSSRARRLAAPAARAGRPGRPGRGTRPASGRARRDARRPWPWARLPDPIRFACGRPRTLRSTAATSRTSCSRFSRGCRCRVASSSRAPRQPPADLTRLRVTLAPVVTPGSPGEIASTAAGRVDAEGRFTIASVVPGRYRLTGIRRWDGLVPRLVDRRRPGLARFPGRGQTQSEHQRRGHHVRRSPVRAHRHDRQRARAARARLHA